MAKTDEGNAATKSEGPADSAPAEPEIRIGRARFISPETLAWEVEKWWLDHFPGSAVARDVPAWNVAHAAKEDLKRRLVGLR